MKALQILIYIRRNKFIMDLLDEDSNNKAIAELEALQQPKSCNGCKDEHKDAYSLPCAACIRNCDSDYYEPKEQWDDTRTN